MEDVRRRVLSDDQHIVQAAEPEAAISKPAEASGEESIYEPGLGELVDERYYYIPGELFIIKYEDVKNMNITYYEEEIAPG